MCPHAQVSTPTQERLRQAVKMAEQGACLLLKGEDLSSNCQFLYKTEAEAEAEAEAYIYNHSTWRKERQEDPRVQRERDSVTKTNQTQNKNKSKQKGKGGWVVCKLCACIGQTKTFIVV